MTITRRRLWRRITGTVVAVAAACGLTAAAASPAAAATPAGGCRYPQVCIYPDGQLSRPSGKFVDVTAGWQYLGRSFGARSFRNTRHDDVAYIKTTTGRVICVRPGTTGGLINGGATAIRISWRSTCR